MKILTYLKIIGFSIFVVYLSGLINAQDRFSTFENQSSKDDQRFSGLQSQIEERWGRYLESTKPRWVQYSSDLKSERIVEFKEGYVQISVLREQNELNNQTEVNKIKTELKDLLIHRLEVDLPPLLDNQIIIHGQTLSASNLDKNWGNIRKSIVQEEIKQKKEKRDKPTSTRLKSVLRLRMTPDHLKKRATQYLPLVQRYSREFGLNPSLVLAIIHTESYFNPYAKSSVACGLMQLVPKSGAREAYKKRYNIDKIVGPNYLYDPKQNIELGTQYLEILNQTFRNVNHPLKIQYMSISSYNTGPTNLSRSLTQDGNISKAIMRANNMAPQKLYQILLNNLPYEETRDYLQKVTKRIPLYSVY